jgi:hypothetical protein
MKVPLSEQIAFLEQLEPYQTELGRARCFAALSTLKWVERHQAELRILAEFPIEKLSIRCVVRRDEE